MEITSILPDDVLEEILLRLPVKHLLQLKCVCKHWYSLIGDYGFHKKHYHCQYAMHLVEHHDIPLFLDETVSSRESFFRTQFYLLSKHQGADAVLNVTPDLDRDIPPAFADDPELYNLGFHCMGVVNGVIGLQWGGPFFSWERNRLALWNPATREFKGIPHLPFVSDNKSTKVILAKIIGLGFDLQSADFKILGLNNIDSTYEYYNTTNLSEYILYSLKSNTWKRIKEAPNPFFTIKFSDIDAQLNNSVYYWLASGIGDEDYHRKRIISFNFSTEVFKQFEPPEGLGCPHNEVIRSADGQVYPCGHGLKIGKYKEGLALFVSGSAYQGGVKVEMWVVTKFRDDDCDVPLSWQLGLTVGPLQSFSAIWLCTVRVCGDLLLLIQRENRWDMEVGCLYDPSTSTYNFLELTFGSSYSYVESLFSLSGVN